MPERRVEVENRSRLDEIHEDYLRFSRRVGITLAIIITVLIMSLGGLAYLIKENRDLAHRAEDKSEGVRISAIFAKEKVCSQSSDRLVACRALFDRLAESLSDAQRKQLACSVVDQLAGKLADRLQEQSECPKP